MVNIAWTHAFRVFCGLKHIYVKQKTKRRKRWIKQKKEVDKIVYTKKQKTKNKKQKIKNKKQKQKIKNKKQKTKNKK
jgi:hypothetical protein